MFKSARSDGKRWKWVIPSDCIRRYRHLNGPISSCIKYQLPFQYERFGLMSGLGRLTRFQLLKVMRSGGVGLIMVDRIC